MKDLGRSAATRLLKWGLGAMSQKEVTKLLGLERWEIAEKFLCSRRDLRRR